MIPISRSRHPRLPWLLVLLCAGLSSCGIRLPEPPPAQARHARQPMAHPPAEIPPPARSEDAVTVWLIADTLHTGLIFDYPWLLESGFIPPAGLKPARHVSMSWGDQAAYLSRRWLGPWPVFRALFLPSPAVTEIIPFQGGVLESSPNQRVWKASFPRDRGPALASFLNHCNLPDATGRPQVVGPASWGEGLLMASRHPYFFPRICNVWTGQAIEALGGEMPTFSSIDASSLLQQAEKPANGFVFLRGPVTASDGVKSE